MKLTTNVKGQLALSKTELRALELGYVPSKPVFDTRYDLIIDDLKTIKRIQVKYADGKPSSTEGSVVVKLAYEDRKKKVYTYGENEVDGLVVYLPKVDKLCFIPPELFIGKRNLNLRIDKAKNNQKKNVIYAKDFYW